MDSTPVTVSVSLLSAIKLDEPLKIFFQVLSNYLSDPQSLLVLAALWICYLLFQRKLSQDRFKVMEQRKLLSDEKFAAGQELLTLMGKAGVLFKRFNWFNNKLVTDVRTILLVEDEKSMHCFKEEIEAAFPNTDVRLANNGAEAWAQILRKRPSLIITDLVMPVMDGFQLLRKSAVHCPDIPVIVISAYISDPKQIAAEIGTLPTHFEFVPKPSLFQKLFFAIRHLLDKNSETKHDDSALAL
jgi:CheY-like chemotaxis protein